MKLQEEVDDLGMGDRFRFRPTEDDPRSLGWLGFLGLLGFTGFQNPFGFAFFAFLVFFRYFLPPRGSSGNV